MKKNGRKKDHKHKGTPRTMEGNQEISHRQGNRGIGASGNRIEEGAGEEMTESQKDKIVNQSRTVEVKLQESIQLDQQALKKLEKQTTI